MSTGRELIIKILGDSKSAERALEDVSHKSEHLGGKFGGLAKAAAIVGGVGGVGLVVEGLKKSVEAATQAQASQAGLDAALKATHQSVKAMTPAIEEAAKKSRDLGFSDIDTEHALMKLEIATGNTKQSIKDLSVAQDIARVKHMSLESASQMLAQAMTGSQRAAKQLGIVVNTTSTNVDELKRSHENLTTATGKADLAHAKLMDKMATGQAVIAAVTDKVKGQADAYANTAAGSMARFHAASENLQVMIGTKLVPVLTFLVGKLTDVVNYIEAHWSQISAVFSQVMHVVQAAWDSVGRPVFDAVISFSQRVISFVQGNWPQITATVREVFNTIRSIVETVVGVVEGLWRAFGGTIKTVISNDIETVKGVFSGLFTSIKGVFNLIDDLIHGRWSQLWGDAKQIVSGVFTAIESVLEGAVKNVAAIAARIGSGIKDGLLAAVTGIGHGLANILTSALNYLIDRWNSFHIHIPGIHLFGKTIIPDVDFSFPNIPHLAAGGIATRPTLALIGENGPEAVVPLNRGYGGLTINVEGDVIGVENLIDRVHAGLLRKQQSMSLGIKAA